MEYYITKCSDVKVPLNPNSLCIKWNAIKKKFRSYFQRLFLRPYSLLY